MKNVEHMTQEEMAQRIAFALLAPTATIARIFEISLSDAKHLVDIAYFQEMRRQGLTLQAIASAMKVSMSKAALMSRALKSNFIDDADSDLPRKILFMLWAGPLSLARMRQILTDVEPKELKTTLRTLIKDNKIAEEDGEYRLLVQADRRVWDQWISRIDGMNNLVRHLTDTIYGRFFADESIAFARTLSFRLRPNDLERLQSLYQQIFELVVELDQAAQGHEDALEVNLSVLWAEKDLTRSTNQGEEK